MPSPEPTRRATPVFDREHTPPAERAGRRRRRPAPDWGGDELFDRVPRRRFARPDASGQSAARRPTVAIAFPSDEVDVPAPPVRPPAPVLRRRSVEQRITASPDRVAAWAFALGLLLIIVALLTSL